ncbi:Retrovirus-related Pol polyprotein from transposon 17.6, partial [Schistosoma japonicum]
EFGDGDVGAFLRQFGAVAKLVGVRGQKARVTVLGTPLRGCAKAVLDDVVLADGGATWEEVVARLVSEFDSPADRELALQKFRAVRLAPDGDPSVLATTLTSFLRRGLLSLDDKSRQQLLTSQFLMCVPGDVARQLRLAHAVQPSNVMEMARMCRQLVSTSVSSLTEDSRTAPMEKRIAELEEKVAAVRIRAERGSRCFQCGEFGHYRRNCPRKRRLRHFKRYTQPSLFETSFRVVGLVNKGALYTRVRINGRVLVCLVDTGAAISLINVGLCREIRACSLAVQTVSGHALKILGVSDSCVKVGDRVVRYPFVVTKDIQQTILGADFLREVETVIDTKNKTVNTKYGHFSVHENSQIAKTRAAILPQVNIENINKVIAKYGSLFTDDGEAYGYCDRVTHEIPVNSRKKTTFHTRRIPVHLETEVNRQVEEMLRDGIIEEADSRYNSPVLLVKKSNGKYRFCVDFRELNSITELKPCPMPTVAETLDRLQQAKLFTLPIKADDRYKTAFTVGHKQYQFRRMPFGLAGAPFTFRRLMNLLLRNLENVEVYGDDLVVYSKTERDHARHLEAVLKRIEEFGLRINKKKSQIAKCNVTLLGYKVGDGEMKPLPEKILTIQNITAPTSKRKFRQFIGRAAFYSRFIKNFNEIAAPLYKLPSSGKFIWTEEAQKTFDRIKQLLNAKQMTLRLPVYGKQFTVATDASDFGIGAVLRQDDGVVEYASRVLTPTEQKYSTIEKECLAIVWAVDKWRPYLLGQPFHIETDYKPLQWLKTARDPRGKLSRWTLRLQEYDFTIGHIPGSRNDASLPEVACGVNRVQTDLERLLRCQKADPTLRTVRRALTEAVDDESVHFSREVKTLLSQKDRLRLNAAGVLTWKDNDGSWIPVIPKPLRHELISECHQLAHTGVARTTDLLRQSAYWPGMQEDVMRYVLACPQCQLMKGDKCIRTSLQPIPVTTIGDLCEEFTSRLGQLGIKKIRTTPYHPQTNGLTERNNHTLKE